MPTHPFSPFSHAHIRTHHWPDSSPPGLTQWACYKKASVYGSRVGWTHARTILIAFSAFDMVGCQEERPACTNWAMSCWRGYLSAARCNWFAHGPADATATPSSLTYIIPNISCVRFMRMHMSMYFMILLSVLVFYFHSFVNMCACHVYF